MGCPSIAQNKNGTSVAACPVFSQETSEVELGADLADAGISRPGHDAHLPVQIPVRVIELRMIEHVKEFGADLERLRLSNFGALHQTDVEIVDSGAVEELTIGVAKPT